MLAPYCAVTIKTGAKTIHHEHHLKIQNHDRRAAGQTNSAGQPAAGLIQPFTNSVQHVRRCRCGPVRRFHGTRLRGLDGDVCHTVHRLSDRLEQWRQRAGRPLLRCRAPQGRQQDRPFGAAGQPGRRCAAAVRRPVRLACAAGAAEHQGGPAARCDFVPAGLLSRYAGVGALQLRQRSVQRYRRDKKAAGLPVVCGRAEHPAQPVFRHRLQARCRRCRAGQHDCPVRLGRADPARADKGQRLLCAGFPQGKAGPQHDKAHPDAGRARGPAKRGLCDCQPLYSGGRQLLRLADGQGQLRRS